MPRKTSATPQAAAFALVGAAMVASAITLLYLGRGATIGGDDLEYAVRLAQQPFGHTLLHTPPNKYLIAVPLALYKAMLETFGLGSYIPYRVVSIGLVVLNGGLFFALARRRIGDLPSVAPALLLLFFGAAGPLMMTAERIPGLMATAAGLAALLALDRRDLPGDLGAALLLVISIASHPVGTAYTAGAAVLIVLRPPPERWTRAWVFLAPAVVFGAWWLFWRAPSQTSVESAGLGSVMDFMVDSWVTLTAAVSGLLGVLDPPVYTRPLAQIAGVALFLIVSAGLVRYARRLPPSFWATLVALLVLLAAARLSPAGFLRVPDSGRYLYPEVFLFLLLLVELAGTVRPWRWVTWAATGVIVLGLVSNLNELSDWGRAVRQQGEANRGNYTAYELSGSALVPEYRPTPYVPMAGNYLDASAAFGSPGLSESELENASPATRRAADQALVGALGIQPLDARLRAPSGKPPQVDRLLDGTATRRGPCTELRPDDAASSPAPEAPPPLLAVLVLPRGGVRLPGDPTDARFALGRFADPPSVLLTTPDGGGDALLSIPPDESTMPWKLTVAASRPVSVCAVDDGS